MEKRKGIIEDDRGVVLTFGVFMMIILVGLLWYVMGIGDAVIHRERLQDGADSVAYAAAVYHARGMNMIAMINLIMASLVGVLVALKLIQLMNTVASTVSCGLAWIGPTAPICAATSGLEVPIADSIAAAQSVVDTTVPLLSEAQKGIALVMPFVAEGKAIAGASAQSDHAVTRAAVVSVSLIPFVPPARYALPVSEDAYSTLCAEGISTVATLALRPFGAFGTWVGSLTGAFVGTFPQYFCGDTKTKSPLRDVGGVMGKAAESNCAERLAHLRPDDQKTFDRAACIAGTKSDLEEQVTKAGALPGSRGLSAIGKTPKKVYDNAENGNGFFQVWAIVGGSASFVARDDAAVQLANWNGSALEAPQPEVTFAQAEYYFDTPFQWAFIAGDALWAMRWRARLVRFRPIDAVTSTLGSILGEKLNGFVESKVFEKFEGKSKWIEFFARTPSVDVWIKGNTASLLKGTSHKGVNDIESLTVGNPTLGYIH